MQDLNKMIKDNEGLVYKQLHRFNLVGNPDAESLAFEALFKACLNYDKSTGNTFSTFATCCIYNAIGMHLRQVSKKRQLQVISYNTVYSIDDHGDEHELLEFIDGGERADEQTLRQELVINVRRVINESIEQVNSDIQKRVLILWRDSEYSMSTLELAKRAGTSQSYVSRIITNFKASLKPKLEEFYYD